MENLHNQLFEIIIDKRTDLGKSHENRTIIREIVINAVSKIDANTLGQKAKELSKEYKTEIRDLVFRLPAYETDTYLTLFTDCSTDAFESIKRNLEEEFPNVCSFKQWNLT